FAIMFSPPLMPSPFPYTTLFRSDGLFVCPGFVDMHTHSDLQLLANPAHEAKVHQGVTLEVLGQDGLSYAPVDDEVLDQLRSQLADRKSTRLNSSHGSISYAVFCL